MPSTREHTHTIKKELKENWPNVTFSVRQPRSRGLEIEWTDGPDRKEVEEIASRFGGNAHTRRNISPRTWDKAAALWQEHGREFHTFPLSGVNIVSGSREQQIWQIAMNVVLTGRARKPQRQTRTDRVLRYSPNSALVSTTVEGILTWAADHITHVGLARNRQGRMFDGPGTIRRLRCNAVGAIEVAAGMGRHSRNRTYDTDAINNAKEGAYLTLAEYLCRADRESPALRAIRQGNPRALIHGWGMEPGRTAEEVVTALRGAAQSSRYTHACEE